MLFWVEGLFLAAIRCFWDVSDRCQARSRCSSWFSLASLAGQPGWAQLTWQQSMAVANRHLSMSAAGPQSR